MYKYFKFIAFFSTFLNYLLYYLLIIIIIYYRIMGRSENTKKAYKICVTSMMGVRNPKKGKKREKSKNGRIIWSQVFLYFFKLFIMLFINNNNYLLQNHGTTAAGRKWRWIPSLSYDRKIPKKAYKICVTRAMGVRNPKKRKKKRKKSKTVALYGHRLLSTFLNYLLCYLFIIIIIYYRIIKQLQQDGNGVVFLSSLTIGKYQKKHTKSVSQKPWGISKTVEIIANTKEVNKSHESHHIKSKKEGQQTFIYDIC